MNLYTKFYLVLYTIKKYGKENYIPNQLFMNKFKVGKKTTIRIINKMKEDKIIRIYYINNKRYFDFIDKELEQLKNSSSIKDPDGIDIKDILNYDWLNDNF